MMTTSTIALISTTLLLVLAAASIFIDAVDTTNNNEKQQHLHDFYGWNLIHCDVDKMKSLSVPRLEIFFEHQELTPDHHQTIQSIVANIEDQHEEPTHRQRLRFIMEKISPEKSVFENFLSSFEKLSPFLKTRTFDSLVFEEVPVGLLSKHILASDQQLCLFSSKKTKKTSLLEHQSVFIRVHKEEDDDVVTQQSLAHPTLKGFPQYSQDARKILRLPSSSLLDFQISRIDGLFIHSLVHGQAKPHHAEVSNSQTSNRRKSSRNSNNKKNSLNAVKNGFPSQQQQQKQKRSASSLSSSSTSSGTFSPNTSAFVSPLPSGSPSWVEFGREWNATEKRFRYTSATFAINCRNGEAMTPASNFCNSTDPASRMEDNTTFTEEFPAFVRITSGVAGSSSSSSSTTRTWDNALDIQQCLLASDSQITAWKDTTVSDHVLCGVYFPSLSSSENSGFFGDDTLRTLSAQAAFKTHTWNPQTQSYNPQVTYEMSPVSVASPYSNGLGQSDRSGNNNMPMFFQEGPGYRPNEIATMTQLTPTPFEPCDDGTQQQQTCTSHLNIKKKLSQGIIELPVRTDAQSSLGFKPEDVKSYFDVLPYRVPMFNFTTDLKIYGNPNLTEAGEASLDVELMMALSPGLDTVVWTIEQQNGNFGNQMLATTKALVDGTAPFLQQNNNNNNNNNSTDDPAVWSVSWGVTEVAFYSDPSVTKQVDKYLELLQIAGVSFFVSTGDIGAMSSNDNLFPSVSFPACLAHAIAVGGASPTTQYGWVPTTSVANNAITTGGGFSKLSRSNSYQQQYFNDASISDVRTFQIFTSDTNQYQKDALTNTTSLNRRGLPDFSALASSILVYVNGGYSLMSGTSASSPISASLFMRMNYQLYAAGYNFSISNITQFLYSRTATRQNCTNCWTDLKEGDNCATEGANGATLMNFQTLYKNFGCYGNSNGWDPVDGVGVPNYAALLSKSLEWAKYWNYTQYGNNNNNGNSDNGNNNNGGGNSGGIVIGASVGGVLVIGIIAFAMYQSGKFGCGGDDASAANTQFVADTNYRDAAKEMDIGTNDREAL